MRMPRLRRLVSRGQSRGQPARGTSAHSDAGGRQPPRTPNGTPLPPPRLRMGGSHFRSDADFLAGALSDLAELRQWCNLGPGSSLLDWGCGAGRLAIGIREEFGRIGDYHGVDVQQRLIGWADRNLSGPGFRFTKVDDTHVHYNPGGAATRTLPVAPGSVDVFYAYSVFSHLAGADTIGYLGALAQALRDNGRGWFTLFVEEGVADEVENPPDYGPLDWTVPLHCVRYSRSWFEAQLAAAGLAVVTFSHGAYTDGQSRYVVRRALPD
ncbi:MAG: methyltransferase domain-containing protein [Actinomycetales bacterium]|nr:methyltransferase domain-containing protein [Actinomycetales bacterium]